MHGSAGPASLRPAPCCWSWPCSRSRRWTPCWCTLAERPSLERAPLWRSRELAVAVAVGLLVTVFVIARDSRREGVTYTIGAAPLAPETALEITGKPRATFTLPRLPAQSRGEVQVHIATYLERPTATVRFAILDARGRSQAQCIYPPSSYSD